MLNSLKLFFKSDFCSKYGIETHGTLAKVIVSVVTRNNRSGELGAWKGT